MERLHISFFGSRNAGKSSLINALTGQDVSIVSEVAGTTTDPVTKPMELHPLGAVMLTDTAGYDDEGALGEMRVGRTKQILRKTDVAVFVVPSDVSGEKMKETKEWYDFVMGLARKVVVVVNDFGGEADMVNTPFADGVKVNALTGDGVYELKKELEKVANDGDKVGGIVGHLVKEGDVVMLVMPQDLQAPKGRLILPQVQTIRDLLDEKCIVVSCTVENFVVSIEALKEKPALIITDSQAFKEVYKNKPEGVRLTSFSVLMARLKGDINEFVEGAAAIDSLTEESRVLIAEACTHAPLAEDIGREQIPAMLRKRFGEGIRVDMVSGSDWPDDVAEYDLIVHCGACMFNSAHVKSRQEIAKMVGVPMTNYGVFIAAYSGILEKIEV